MNRSGDDVDLNWPQGQPIDTNGITLNVNVFGTGPAVVLVHGFPDFGYTWRHQIRPLVESGYRVIVPDMRGSGASDRPDDIASYGVDVVARDLMGILDALGEEKAAFVGHDWGASVVWYVSVAHADRVSAVAGLSVPVMRPAPVAPMSIFERKFGNEFYMVWFQKVGESDAALNADPRRTLQSAYGLSTFDPVRHGWELDEIPALPKWFTPEAFEVYVEAFTKSGFTGGINYYRNIDHNWALWKDREKIPVPAMFATGSLDGSNAFMPATDLDEMCADVRRVAVIENAGHHVQQEVPDIINKMLIGFLADAVVLTSR